MHIEIDFDVFKTLTALRESESDSYNQVIRRLLSLTNAELSDTPRIPPPSKGILVEDAFAKARFVAPLVEAMKFGVWFGQRHFPEGTKFRATYKGKSYFAEVRDGNWVGQDGIVRRSPSDAAGAISGTNVNGWRFWYAQIPPDQDWHRLDEFK